MRHSKLPRDTRIIILQSILKKVDNKYSSFLFYADITSIDFDKNELPLLYSLCTYMTSIKENKAASDFFKKISRRKKFINYALRIRLTPNIGFCASWAEVTVKYFYLINPRYKILACPVF